MVMSCCCLHVTQAEDRLRTDQRRCPSAFNHRHCRNQPLMQPSEGSEAGDDDAQAGAQQNAFTALMSRKPQDQQKRQESPRYASSTGNVFKNRDGLGAYLDNPASLSSSSSFGGGSGSGVVTYNANFVTIHDLYPKSSVHLLLLSRDRARTHQHPFTALADADFLAQVRAETAKTRHVVAAELRRRYGRFSHAERARRDAMERDIDGGGGGGADDDGDGELPAGRDWDSEVMCGVHAHPSMNHLHIHVLSVDRHSARMKHRKHYNSFATPFFVPLDDFPLAEDDVRRHPGREGYLRRDLVCWRCGENFGNKFTRLKEHLEEEFEEWKCL